MNEMEPRIPIAVICVSPYLTPSRYKTDSEYELMRQLSARIWYCDRRERVSKVSVDSTQG
jgi:hypothetical protein